MKLIILAILVMLGLGIYFVYTTPSGLVITAKLISKIISPNLFIDKITGTFKDGITIEKMHFENKNFNLVISKINLQPKLKKILSLSPPLTKLHIEDVQLLLKKTNEVGYKNISLDKLVIDLKNNVTNSTKTNMVLQLVGLKFKDIVIDQIFARLTPSKLFGYSTMKGTADFRKIHGKISNLDLILPNANLAFQWKSPFIFCQGFLGDSHENLIFNGKTFISSKAINGNLFIHGKNFLIVNTKEYKLRLSPELQLEFTNDSLKAKGNINVDEAIIKPIGFYAYSLLPNELTYSNESSTGSNVFNLSTDINIHLGKKTYIEIAGLKGKINGTLQILETPQKLTLAQGKLYIQDGTYSIYNQILKVVQGELKFINNPINDPKINLKAIREFSNITQHSFFNSKDQKFVVGVKINGNISHPNIRLFSDPAELTNADILSYLILGQSAENISENNGKLIFHIASLIDTRNNTGNLINKFKQKLGLNELSLVDEFNSWEANNSKLHNSNPVFTLGKYLTPKIYVSYSLGLLNSVNIFKVKYSMGKYFALGSETSSLGSSGVDLIYTLEY